jgi:predicted metal-dependent enzyme (double-stranded beta helix superfamily)
VFDVDELIKDCREAVTGGDSLLAVRDVLAEALSDRAAVAAALPVTKAELTPLYSGTDVTIMKIVWAPSMTIAPHDHHMWACIGIYGGEEVNRLFRRADGTIVESGGFEIDEGEIGLLGDDAIHSVTNPLAHQFTAAIHIYGGDFLNVKRSNWVGDPLVEEPMDAEETRLLFEEANRAL